MTKKFEICNRTAEFLILGAEGKEDGMQVVYKDESAWVTDCTSDNISAYLRNINDTGELLRGATTEISSVVQSEDNREVTRKLQFNNLDAINSVSDRVNSLRATQFRQWSTYACSSLPHVVIL